MSYGPTPLVLLIRVEKTVDAWALTVGSAGLANEPKALASAEEVLRHVRSFLNMTRERGDTLQVEITGQDQIQGDLDTAGVCAWLGLRMGLHMDPATGNIIR